MVCILLYAFPPLKRDYYWYYADEVQINIGFSEQYMKSAFVPAAISSDQKLS